MSVPVAGGNDLYLAARAVVADGVIAQVLAQFIQQCAAAQHRDTLAQISQGDIGAAGVQFLALHALLGNLQKVYRFHYGGVPGLTYGIQLRKLQNIVDQLDHAGSLAVDLAAEIRHILRLCNAGLNQLCIAGNAGQRGLELMADIGSKLLPHFLVVFSQNAVGVDALCKGDQFPVGHIFLNVIQILSHVQHRLYQCFGQQGCQHRSGQHQRHTAQYDGRDGGIIDGPHGLGVLCHAQHIPAGKPERVVIGLIAHSLGIADVPALAVCNGIADLRAGQMVLHGLVGGRFKQHAAVLTDQRHAQIIGHKGTQLCGVSGLLVPGAHKIGLALQPRPCLRRKGFMEYKNAQRCGEYKPQKAHQEQPVADLFFHAAQLHSSSASSSVSL